MFTAEERGSVHALALNSGFEPAVILAFTQVESGGRSFWNVGGKNYPAIRPEGHYFYRLLKAKDHVLCDMAVQRGLASPKAGAVKVPNTYAGVYDMFAHTTDIDETCALQSISMGVGQVMGEHYKSLGFITVQQMWNTACSGLSGQVDIMLRFINSNPKLVAALKADDWATAAKLYNGPCYKQNKYDTKLEQAVNYWRAHSSTTPVIVSADSIKLPSDIDADRIKKLGYESTEDFQRKMLLRPDGDIGPMTSRTITEVEQKRKEPTKNGAGAALGAGGGIVATLLALQGQITELLPVLEIFKGIGAYGPLAAAAVAGAAIIGGAVFAVYKIKHVDVAVS